MCCIISKLLLKMIPVAQRQGHGFDSQEMHALKKKLSINAMYKSLWIKAYQMHKCKVIFVVLE